jgi:hypothetical protein
MKIEYDVCIGGTEPAVALIPLRDSVRGYSEVRYKPADDTFWLDGLGVSRRYMLAVHREARRTGRHTEFNFGDYWLSTDGDVVVALLRAAVHFRRMFARS